MHLRHFLVPTTFAVACTLALAACGSSTKPNSSTSGRSNKPSKIASGGVSAGIKLADCMRAHGVPKFPDPSSSGGVFGQAIARAGINPQSPAFQSATDRCRGLMEAGKSGYGPGPAARKAQLVTLARCMRAHGLRTFPDPSAWASAPASNAATMGYSGPGGSLSLSVPDSMIQSPGFKRAAAICGFPVLGQKKKAPAA